MWQQWLPAKYREAGPRVERHRLGELSYTGGTSYEYDLDPADGSGDWCDIWFYEDGMYPHKRHVAAVGFDRDDMTLSPITYDEMRPAATSPRPAPPTCWPTTWTSPSASPRSPASAARPSTRPRTPTWAWPASGPTTTG